MKIKIRYFLLILSFASISSCCSFRELKREKIELYLFDIETKQPLRDVYIGTLVKGGVLDFEDKTDEDGKFKLKRQWEYNTPCDRMPLLKPSLYFKKQGLRFSSSDSISKGTLGSYPLQFSKTINGDTIFLSTHEHN